MFNIVVGIILMIISFVYLFVGVQGIAKPEGFDLNLGDDLPNGKYVMIAGKDRIVFTQNGTVYKTYVKEKPNENN